MYHSRPINLNLFTIHFPIPAIVSILHRISGFILFFMLPIILWAFYFSLTPHGFATLQTWFEQFYLRAFFWFLCIPLCFHSVAGIRHLLMDVHIGEKLETGRMMSSLTFFITFLLMIMLGMWLW